MLSVVIHEKDYTATVGEQVILKCSVSGFPCVKSVYWELISPEGQTEQLDKGLLKYHGSNPNDPSLVIKDIREEDAGEYKCTVSNCMASKSASTMLTVNGDIPFVEILETSHTSVIGDQVKMECSISAIPPIISVSWQHRALGGHTVRHCFDQKRYAGGNLNDPCLVIHEVTKKDEGEYVCTASNLCGKQPSAPSYLTVNGGLPQLSILSDEYSIPEGYTAVLQCSVDALPSALAIKWSKKGGGSQIAIDNKKYMSGSLESPSLVITNTEKIADEGLYTCEAENKAGSQNASVQLKIQKKTANTIPEKPATFPPDANAKEQIERNVKMVHAKMVNKLSGQISPKLENWPRFIEYLKAVLEPVDLQEGFHVIVQRLMSKMEIDHGYYKILSEAVKEADEKATLIIRKAEADIKTIREGDMPTIRFSKAHYQFKQGQAGFLECTVVAKPEVEYIKWFRVNGEKREEITLNNRKYFGEPKLPMLMISSLGRADQGLYFCRAGHQAGEAESDAAFVEIFDDTIRTHQFREPPGARNVYLRFSVPDDATSVQNTVIVRLSQTGTYFCAICFIWSFMGLQEFADGAKVIIFSVWDNKKNNDPESAKQAKIMHRCDNLDITRFGGQGTGLRCYLPYNWLLNEDVIFRVDAEQDRPWTAYAGHYFDKRTNKWHHIATIKTITNGSLIGSCNAFVNDFTRDGRGFRQKRKAVFSNVQYSVQGKWIECTEATFTADSDEHVRNINAGSEGKGRMFLETGGDICNSNTLLNGTVSAK